MASPKVKLEEAIKNNDMEYVREYYKDMYDQEAPEIEKGSQNDFSELKSLVDRFFELIKYSPDKMSLKPIPEEIGQTVIEEVEPVSTKKNKLTKKKRQSKKNQQKPKGRAITGSVAGMEDEEYKQAIKKHAKERESIRETRDPYVPDLRNCDKCGNEFDYAKEYPATMTESETILCFTCDRKNSKNRK